MDLRESAEDRVFRGEGGGAGREANLTGDSRARGASVGRDASTRRWRSGTPGKHRPGPLDPGSRWAEEYAAATSSRSSRRFSTRRRSAPTSSDRTGSIGEGMVGLMLLAFGTMRSKSMFPARIRRGEQMRCQLSSEPSTSALTWRCSTRAEWDGDDACLDGQKVWVLSLAAWADSGFAIVRTQPDRNGTRARRTSSVSSTRTATSNCG